MKGTNFEPLKCESAKTDREFKHVEIFRNVCNYNVSYYQVRSKGGKVLFNADRFEDAEKFALKHDFEREKNRPLIESETEKMDRRFREFKEQYINTEENENNTDTE